MNMVEKVARRIAGCVLLLGAEVGMTLAIRAGYDHGGWFDAMVTGMLLTPFGAICAGAGCVLSEPEGMNDASS